MKDGRGDATGQLGCRLQMGLPDQARLKWPDGEVQSTLDCQIVHTAAEDLGADNVHVNTDFCTYKLMRIFTKSSR